MNLSANGFLEAVLTLHAENDIPAGTPVKLTGNYTVEAAENGEAFCGVALSCRDHACAVRLRGTSTTPFTGNAPTPGSTGLASDGEGGVQSSENGTQVLVLACDNERKTVTYML